MDLANEYSASDSVDDREAFSSKMVPQVDANGTSINGPYANNREVSVENSYDGEISRKESEGEDGVSGKLSSPTLSGTPDGGSPSHRKGVGLKKWRRIRRDHVKDVNPFADSSKMLKRGLSSSINQPKPHFPSPDMKHHGKGSIGSEITERNVGLVPSLTVPILTPDSRFAVGSDVAVAADSDSEDRGSKSSTAASGSKPRQPRSVREKNRIMSATGRSSSSSALRFRQGKGQSEGSKKLRGGRVKLGEENSMSSLESDSVNSTFVHNPSTVNNNRKQGRRSGKYGADNGDGAHQFEQDYIEEAERDKEEVIEGEVEDCLEDDDDATAFSENHEGSRDQDVLPDSILTLQSAQEALEREVQKLGAIGREANPTGISINNDSEFANYASTNPDTSDPHLDSQSMRQKSCSEIQLLQMVENVKALERKLEESAAKLAAKDLHIIELRGGIDHCGSMEDAIYRQKIEAEVGYLVLARTMQAMKSASGTGEQTGLVEEQVEMINKLGETESKAAKLGKLDILGSEEVVRKLERRVCKVSCCLILEFVLLVLVLWVFVLELCVEPEVAVPT